jgi:hypothetical protein
MSRHAVGNFVNSGESLVPATLVQGLASDKPHVLCLAWNKMSTVFLALSVIQDSFCYLNRRIDCQRLRSYTKTKGVYRTWEIARRMKLILKKQLRRASFLEKLTVLGIFF